MSIDRDKLEVITKSWIDEAIELRYGKAEDDSPLKHLSAEDGFTAVMLELSKVRIRADRMSQLRTNAFLLRGKLRRAKAQKSFDAEASFEEAMTERDRTKREFQSALAVKSEASLDSFTQKREAHEANMALDMVDDAYNLIHTLNSQLDVLRNDYRAIIKALQFESTLEH